MASSATSSTVRELQVMSITASIPWNQIMVIHVTNWALQVGGGRIRGTLFASLNFCTLFICYFIFRWMFNFLTWTFPPFRTPPTFFLLARGGAAIPICTVPIITFLSRIMFSVSTCPPAHRQTPFNSTSKPFFDGATLRTPIIIQPIPVIANLASLFNSISTDRRAVSYTPCLFWWSRCWFGANGFEGGGRNTMPSLFNCTIFTTSISF